MKTVKQKVYIVIEYDTKNESRIHGVYVTEEAARNKASRLRNPYHADKLGHTYHVLKKSVQGTELHEDYNHLVFIKRERSYL